MSLSVSSVRSSYSGQSSASMSSIQSVSMSFMGEILLWFVVIVAGGIVLRITVIIGSLFATVKLTFLSDTFRSARIVEVVAFVSPSHCDLLT